MWKLCWEVRYHLTYTQAKRFPSHGHLTSALKVWHPIFPQNLKGGTKHLNSWLHCLATSAKCVCRSSAQAYQAHQSADPSSTTLSHPSHATGIYSSKCSESQSGTLSSIFTRVQCWSFDMLHWPITVVCQNLEIRMATTKVRVSTLAANSTSWWSWRPYLFVKSVWPTHLKKMTESWYN